MEDNREIKYQITPKFNFLYEMGMPTGKKIRTAIFVLILFIVLTIIVALKAGSLTFANYEIFNNIKIDKLLLILCIIADVVTAIKLVATIVFQKLQYNHVTYTFYDTMMTYEDDFLNQHKKNIEYKNIKEVEIRRTIWDRILDYGIMVIYTNADNDRNNGLVIYSVKNPKSHYNVIDKLIHSSNNINNDKYSEQSQNMVNEQLNNKNNISNTDTNVNKMENPEQDFKESLKNINK